VNPWLDEEDLLPGQDWDHEVMRAIAKSDVVVICLSNNSLTRHGYVQKEIRRALDAAQERPPDAIYLIPARIENCEVPERLVHIQYVDLFVETGYSRLMKSIRARESSQK
jgi:hypothetical protein